MTSFIDDILNKVTMYRLVLYYLLVILAAALIFGFFGILPQNPIDLAFSTLVILAASWIGNKLFAKVFDAPTNVESVYITALILTLIISPVKVTDASGIGFLVLASLWAMGSKYIFAIGRKHIFNPAAFGIAIAALLLGHAATWWVAGNYPLLPFVLLGGLLIVRKLRRSDLVLAFAAASLATIAFTSASSPYASISRTFLHSSFFFLAFVMLTEPLTMPPDRPRRIAYGALVGFLFAPNVHFGSLYLTPELALLFGNLFSYVVSPKGRLMLALVEKRKVANGTYEFAFAPIDDRRFSFKPGQYLEWTLPHKHSDDRGNRRYFTIASAPTEPSIDLGVRFYEPMSSFKKELLALQPEETISAAHLAGDFTLPKDRTKKIAFIAGGIGVTPFRSMVQYLLDTNERRDVALFYANRTVADIAYKDIFDRAKRELGLKVVYAVSDERTDAPDIMNGRVDAELIARELPDYKERTFYISGPHGMVEAFKKTLRDMGVPRHRVKIDYFPGFA